MDDYPVLVAGLVFPEGPRWHENRLWFSDMHSHCVHTCDEEGVSRVEQRFDDRPSGLGFLPDGRTLAVLMRSRRLVAFTNGRIDLHADLTPLGGTHLNDMVVNGCNGFAYVGLRHHDASATDARSPERLVLVCPDGSMQVVADDLWGPNGCAITPDGHTLIVAETRGKRISEYPIAQDGTLGERRIFAELDGSPDGLCLDAEGAVWIGNVFKGEYQRVARGGTVLARVALAADKWAVACVLGGADRRTLMMLTAYESVEHFFGLQSFEADLGSTARGFVQTIRVPVAGAGWP